MRSMSSFCPLCVCPLSIDFSQRFGKHVSEATNTYKREQEVLGRSIRLFSFDKTWNVFREKLNSKDRMDALTDTQTDGGIYEVRR
jgi:hypothetical protein